MQLPAQIKEFLLRNPFPSLSFLPVTVMGKEQIVFFLQDYQEYLERLGGRVLVEINFYEEDDAYIMRLAFTTKVISSIESRGFSQIKIETDFPYYETEFLKKDSHVNALKILLLQNSFDLFLYDRYTDYLDKKVISFKSKELLKVILKQRGLL